MRRILLMTAAALLASACSRQTTPAPTPESQSDNAAASAPNGVGSTRDVNGQPPGSQTGAQAGATGAQTTPPSATGTQQTQNNAQSATSRSSADQQGVTASPPQ